MSRIVALFGIALIVLPVILLGSDAHAYRYGDRIEGVSQYEIAEWQARYGGGPYCAPGLSRPYGLGMGRAPRRPYPESYSPSHRPWMPSTAPCR